MKNFEWKSEYSLNIVVIDDQHKQFVQLLSETYALLDNALSAEKLMDLLEKILSFAHVHFTTEEKYFDAFHFEGAQEHKAEHLDLLKEVTQFIEKGENVRDVYSFSFDLLDFLEDWLVHHMSTLDRQYVKCFHDNGLK